MPILSLLVFRILVDLEDFVDAPFDTIQINFFYPQFFGSDALFFNFLDGFGSLETLLNGTLQIDVFIQLLFLSMANQLFWLRFFLTFYHTLLLHHLDVIYTCLNHLHFFFNFCI